MCCFCRINVTFSSVKLDLNVLKARQKLDGVVSLAEVIHLGAKL